MDWGNAIVRSKKIGKSGEILSLEMQLHLEGDFRKTKKKVTWLPTTPLVEATLLDYDYIITKKKLEEDDDVKDLVTPVSEFREFAVADENISELKKGDIIQFERKGYYIFDGVAPDGRYEFIHIPDGRAASIASKAGVAAEASKAKESSPAPAAQTASDTPVDTKMFKVGKIYGDDDVIPKADTKMYNVPNIYKA